MKASINAIEADHQLTLPRAVHLEAAERTMFPTPTASEDHYRLSGDSQQSRSLGSMAAREDGGPLNPMWVEWLMGWPLGWTDLNVSATDKCRQWCDSHGKY